MKTYAKRIVSLMVSLFLLVSSVSVGFTAFAAEEIVSLTNKGSETIVKNDAEIGTATHYEYTWGPVINWEELQALASEGTQELNFKNAESRIYTHQGNGAYTASSPNTSIDKIFGNGIKDKGDGTYEYKCDNGQVFSAEMADVYACSNNPTHTEECDKSCAKNNDFLV